ncbi:MAG TPA: baseplate J/gp47 family protein, partial [Fimbriimonas sp.]
VQFGDGVAGARPESGVENIVASYRKGSGLVGRVRAGQLNMLLTRPLGVIGVTNPLVSSGGTDPESARDAKLNIPRSALTLGRIVSVRDFEDHAARFPGVAKAQAVLLWNGTRQAVHLTVAGPEGEAIDPANLAASIDSVRDARFPFVLDNVEIIRFAVALEVLVKPGFLSEKVFPAVQARIREAFGFSKRLFSEAVTASQILAEVQEVEGVEAANLTGLGSGDDKVLRIKPARSQGGVLLPAQMLLVDDGAIEIKEMKRDL